MFNPQPKIKSKKKRRETVKDKIYYEVFNRDKVCQLCGTPFELQLHHINGRGKNLTNNPKNCIMLCMKCHLYKVHSNQKMFRPILINKINKKYEEE
jgi:5-methylcytosine-specific restriction endonuclease McrA